MPWPLFEATTVTIFTFLLTVRFLYYSEQKHKGAKPGKLSLYDAILSSKAVYTALTAGAVCSSE